MYIHVVLLDLLIIILKFSDLAHKLGNKKIYIFTKYFFFFFFIKFYINKEYFMQVIKEKEM